MGFTKTIKNIWSVEDLRKRIGITLLLVIIYRFGCYVVLPGINPDELLALKNFTADGLNGEQYDYLDKENHKTATLRVHQSSGKLLNESLRKTGDDTDKDDERDAVADTLLVDALTEPHDKHRAGSKNNGHECHSPSRITQVSSEL